VHIRKDIFLILVHGELSEKGDPKYLVGRELLAMSRMWVRLTWIDGGVLKKKS
jgi:hypothetical protein